MSDEEGQGAQATVPTTVAKRCPGEAKEEADPVLLMNLISMEMDKNLSRRALICTKNKSIEDALNWIADLSAEEVVAVMTGTSNLTCGNDEWEDCEDEVDEVRYKMVFVVNTELGMGMGKVASQVGHASIGLYRQLINKPKKFQKILEDWEEFGETKITLKVKNVEELMILQKKAAAANVPFYMVQDAGRTQIPAGSVTVLALFGEEESVNYVTGKLKLL